MQKYLIKFAAFLLISLAIMAGMEYHVRSTDTSPLSYRSKYFYAHADELDGIIFGPSLTARAINPDWLDPKTATLAMAGCAINIDYQVFKEALRHANPKFVIFDLTLAYVERQNDADYENLRRLPHYLGIWNEKAQLKDLFLARAPFANHFLNPSKPADFNAQGFELTIPDAENSEAKMKRQLKNQKFQLIAKRRAGKRYTLNEPNYRANIALLEEIVATCRERNIQLIFYEPPKFKAALDLVPDIHYNRRAAFLDKVVDNETVFWWDLSTLDNDNEANFLNLIHVNVRGAELVSAEINRRLGELGY